MGIGPHSEKTHAHHFNKRQHDHRPEIYCITRDGRLLVFRLDASTTTAVGDFSRFAQGLQIWVPIQCEHCQMIQFIDLSTSYWDEVESDSRSIDSGRTRHYGGRYDCPTCRGSITVELGFSFYASAGIFSKEGMQNANIILVGGIREFFKAAKISSSSDFDTKSDGSLMHFG